MNAEDRVGGERNARRSPSESTAMLGPYKIKRAGKINLLVLQEVPIELEQVPEELVVDLVVKLHFWGLHHIAK
jgi:hypothetical protein